MSAEDNRRIVMSTALTQGRVPAPDTLALARKLAKYAVNWVSE